MKSIIFVCPYFGKLPQNQFPLWLKSCKYNKTINWLIITDDTTDYNYPENVKVKYMDLQDFKTELKKQFNFPIVLDRPYKLCDYKPTYGFALKELIKDYDFWGHCDISDCIFGNLRLFFTEEILDSYDKILFLGHMTLYRNSISVNARIFEKSSYSEYSLNDILGSQDNMAFDEMSSYGINRIYMSHGYSLKRIDNMYYDISPLRYAFQESKYDENYKQYYTQKKPTVFVWKKGRLFQVSLINNKIKEKEIGYVHFQKRKMINHTVINDDSFLILPSGFYSYKSLTIRDIKYYSRDRIYLNFFKLKYAALKSRVKKYILIQNCFKM